MNTSIKMIALAALATLFATGATTAPADAKGFSKGGHSFGHHFGGRPFHAIKFGHGHNACWRFGKWVCGGVGY